jgi:drug/metabolite transporter (DMT)-like permease
VDRLASITLMSIVAGAMALPLCMIIPSPPAAAWPFIGASAVIQIGYCLALAQAYEVGELSQVYPLARGSAPMLVAIVAALSAGEWPSLRALAGLALVSGGIIALGLGPERLRSHGAATALLAGVCIAGYMVSDGLGVRRTPHALSYIAWMMLAQSLPMPFVVRARSGRWPRFRRDRETLKSVGGGVLSVLGYAVVVWALSKTEMARVSGLRETSILFASAIGVIFLGEQLSIRRAGSAVAITIGVICLAA